MKSTVSIIIPNYNHAKFLQQRLDTVFNQTFQDFEVILLDDASTDGSANLLKSYENHPKVSCVVINTENSGSPFRQWKKGIDLAKGDYIWIAESDDYCELNFLEELLPLFDQENVVLAYSASVVINNQGILKGRHKWADDLDKKRWQTDFFNNGLKEIKNYLRFRNTITNASAVLIKRETVEFLPFPYSMSFCGDWYVWIEILKQGNVAYTGKLLNYFRRHDASTKFSKTFEKEKQRMGEYMDIFLANSSLFTRLLNSNKYSWVSSEWKTKKDNFPNKSISDLELPTDFLWLFNVKK